MNSTPNPAAQTPGDAPETTPVYTLYRGNSPLLVSLPHVGTRITDALKPQLVDRVQVPVGVFHQQGTVDQLRLQRVSDQRANVRQADEQR